MAFCAADSTLSLIGSVVACWSALALSRRRLTPTPTE